MKHLFFLYFILAYFTLSAQMPKQRGPFVLGKEFLGKLMYMDYHQGDLEMIYYERVDYRTEVISYHNFSTGETIKLAEGEPVNVYQDLPYHAFDIRISPDEFSLLAHHRDRATHLITFNRKTKTVKKLEFHGLFNQISPTVKYLVKSKYESRWDKEIYDTSTRSIILTVKALKSGITFNKEGNLIKVNHKNKNKYKYFALPDGSKVEREKFTEPFQPDLSPDFVDRIPVEISDHMITYWNVREGFLSNELVFQVFDRSKNRSVFSRDNAPQLFKKFTPYGFVTDGQNYALIVSNGSRVGIYFPEETMAYLGEILPPEVFDNNCISGNCKDGYGKWEFSDDHWFEGEMRNFNPAGEGKMRKGKFIYKGTFSSKKLHGRYSKYDLEETYLRETDFYEGFEKGLCLGPWYKCVSGYDTLLHPSGVMVIAHFSKAKPYGEVTEIYPGRRIQTGTMIEGKWHGMVTTTYTDNNNRVSKSIYYNDRLHGTCLDINCEKIELSYGIYSGGVDASGFPHGSGRLDNDKYWISGYWKNAIPVDVHVQEKGKKSWFRGKLRIDYTREEGKVYIADDNYYWEGSFDENGLPTGTGILTKNGVTRMVMGEELRK